MSKFTQDVSKHQGRFTGRVDVSDDDANDLSGLVVMLVSARANDAELKTFPNGDVRRTAVLKVEDFKILAGEARLDAIQQLLKTQVPELEEQTAPIQTIVPHTPTAFPDDPADEPLLAEPAAAVMVPTQSVEDLLASVRAGRAARDSEESAQRAPGGPRVAPTASGRSRKDPLLQKLYDDPTFVS